MVATVNASTSAGVVITPDNSGVLAFQSSSATALTIDASQNATFAGTATATKLIPTGTSVTGNGLYLPAANSLGLSTNGTNAVYIDSSQNVGIGSSTITSADGSAGRIFKISGATNTVFVGETTGNGGFNALILEARNSNRTNARFAQIQMQTTSTATDGGLISFSTSATGTGTDVTERMRIDSSGNLLVGSTTNPSTAKLRFYKTGNRANIEAEQGDSGGYNFQSIAFSNGGTYYHCNFQEGATQRGSITSNGSSTTYATGSDYRLKDNIEPMTNSLQKVLQLKPSIWKWKSNGKNGEGFVAHELQEICPEAVVGQKDAADEDGKSLYQMVDTSFLVATLTAAIQELKVINDTLTARIVALETA